jgi:hypothetical protein
MNLLAAIALVESSGNHMATRFEPGLYASPPRWLIAGLHNLQTFNPHLSTDEALRLLCTSVGLYQILCGNLYGPDVNFGQDIGAYLFSENAQNLYGATFAQKAAGAVGTSVWNEVSGIDDQTGLAFAAKYNGPGQPATYWAAIKKAAGI